MKASRIILASASPRRRQLLAEMGLAFDVVEPGIDERPWPNEAPSSYALRNASDKARASLRRAGEGARKAEDGCVVLAADTIVVCDEHILEKPADARDARRMLRLLSGRGHEVITGLCVLAPGRESARAVTTRVFFRPLSDEEIDAYIASGEPMDKAGAYAIQGGAAAFVEKIDGSYSNVVGLPTEALQDLLAGF